MKVKGILLYSLTLVFWPAESGILLGHLPPYQHFYLINPLLRSQV